MGIEAFTNQVINAKKGSCVFIVGQNPGRQRKGSHVGVVWNGNRSADFLLDCIKGLDNIVLTNVCMYQTGVEHGSWECYDMLYNLLVNYQPKRIITLGEDAYKKVTEYHADPDEVVRFLHPSYIVRFNKDKENYKRQLRKAITKR